MRKLNELNYVNTDTNIVVKDKPSFIRAMRNYFNIMSDKGTQDAVKYLKTITPSNSDIKDIILRAAKDGKNDVDYLDKVYQQYEVQHKDDEKVEDKKKDSKPSEKKDDFLSYAKTIKDVHDRKVRKFTDKEMELLRKFGYQDNGEKKKTASNDINIASEQLKRALQNMRESYEIVFKSGKVKNVVSKDVNKIKNYITESFNKIKSYRRLDEMAGPSIAVMLKHAGFIRKPEGDFRDDGTSFKMFEYKGMPVSVTTSDGQVFASPYADRKYPELDYDELSSVSSYENLDEFNGVDKDKFNAEKLKKNIEIYISEMDSKVGEFTSQSIDIKPITERIEKALSMGRNYLESIKNKIGDVVMSGDDYKVSNLTRYIKMMKDGIKRMGDRKVEIEQHPENRKMLKSYSKYNYDEDIQWYINKIEECFE